MKENDLRISLKLAQISDNRVSPKKSNAWIFIHPLIELVLFLKDKQPNTSRYAATSCRMFNSDRGFYNVLRLRSANAKIFSE
jgi:Ni,Fe-hydrogenase III component G